MIYDDLVNDVIPECVGVPYPVAIRAIKEAVRTFCRESTAYRKTLASTDLTYSAVTGAYTITVPTGFQIETVVSPIVFNGNYTVYTFSDGSQSTSPTPPVGATLVSTDNYTLEATPVFGKSPQWLDINRRGWRSDSRADRVDYFAMVAANSFVLTPEIGVDRKLNLSVTIVLQPDRTTASPTLDDDFGNRWFDYLTAGAKYLLMAMPKVSWSNPELATFYNAKYAKGVEEAKARIKTGLRNPQADGTPHVRGYFK